jgi:hypothetical protein
MTEQSGRLKGGFWAGGPFDAAAIPAAAGFHILVPSKEPARLKCGGLYITLTSGFVAHEAFRKVWRAVVSLGALIRYLDRAEIQEARPALRYRGSLPPKRLPKASSVP